MNVIYNNKYWGRMDSGFSSLSSCIYSPFLPNITIFPDFLVYHFEPKHSSLQLLHCSWCVGGWVLWSFITHRVNAQWTLLTPILNTQVKHELEAIVKVNKEDVLSFLGRYQDKSSEADFRHLLYMDITHSFQVLVVLISGILFFMSWWLFCCAVFRIIIVSYW